MNNSVMLMVNGKTDELPIESFSEAGVVDFVAETYSNGILLDDLTISGKPGGEFLSIKITGLHNPGNGRYFPLVLSYEREFDLMIVGAVRCWTGQWRAK